MVEEAEAEGAPTIEEIVGALREARRGASRLPPFTVVDGGQPNNWGSNAALRGGESVGMRGYGVVADAQNEDGSTDIVDLRDNEIERLLTENARLNERIVFLLKVIEREQAGAKLAAAHAGIETERGAIFRDLRAAVEAELRPFLLVLLRLLEKQRANPAGPAATGGAALASATMSAAENARRAEHATSGPTMPVAAVPTGSLT